MLYKKSEAQESYLRFVKHAARVNKSEDDPLSVGKHVGVGLSGLLFGPLGASIAGGINAPEGKGWGSAASSFAGGLPGALLFAYSRTPGQQILSRLLAGAGGAGAYHLYNKD